jgi:hypothetical protein
MDDEAMDLHPKKKKQIIQKETPSGAIMYYKSVIHLLSREEWWDGKR